MVMVITTQQSYIQSFACAKCLCMEMSTEIDSFGLHWCEKHKGRATIIRYGYRNAYPAIATDEGVLMPDCESYLKMVKHCKSEQCIAALVSEIARMEVSV